tara:strand:+ start:54 stop:641 length:588 start_codon:yes stop_codon:yes gene_type:complete
MVSNLKLKNRRLGAVLFLVSFVMVGAAYAAVPLYDLFCRVTGYGGTTQIATNGPQEILDRKINIRFNADIDRKLPWQFKPVQENLKLKIGQRALVFFKATNLSNEEIIGTASFNVMPAKAGQYFNKIDCFCFTEQKLAAGSNVEMPVSFFIDPALATDPNLDDIDTITLSYTFFKMNAVSRRAARTKQISINLDS